MSKLTANIIIDAPPSEVWKSIGNVGEVHKWHPVVKTSPVLTDNATGIGATRMCNFHDGTSVVEKVIAIDEGKSVTLELSEFSMPFNTAHGVVTLVELDGGRTRVEMDFEYTTKYGPVGWLMDAAMIRPMMTKMFDKVLGGLKHHVQTGDYIGEDGPVQQAA